MSSYENTMQFQGFDWDDNNKTKNLKKHKVSRLEIEEIFLNEPFVFPDLKHSETEERFLAFGETNQDRRLIVAFTMRKKEEGLLIRPISARPMHKKERVLYEKTVAQEK